MMIVDPLMLSFAFACCWPHEPLAGSSRGAPTEGAIMVTGNW